MQHHDPVEAPGGEEEEASVALKSRLGTAENVLATVPVDLDGELRFSTGLLALTDRRLLARDAEGRWAEWPLAHP
jgi:ATP-binding cassette subfamily B protein